MLVTKMIDSSKPLTNEQKLLVNREMMFRVATRDAAYFARMFWTIRTKEGGKMGFFARRLFELREFQADFVHKLAADPFHVVLKGRQIGFTELLAMYCAWTALFHSDSNVFYVSRIESDAKEVAKSIRDIGIPNMPAWLYDHGLPRLTNSAEDELIFSNGSKIEIAVSGTGNPVRSRSASLVVLDEFAYYKYQDSVLNAVEPAASNGGRVILSSTSAGPDNTFAQIFTDSQLGEDTPYKHSFYGWRCDPSHDDAWYQSQLAGKKTQQQRAAFAREHPDSPEDAFLNVGRLVFDPEVVDACLAQSLQRQPLVGVLDGENGPPQFILNDEGDLKIYLMPSEVAQEKVVIGADVAQGLEHGDSSCAVVLSGCGNVAAVYHGKMNTHQYGQFLALLGEFYGFPLIGVEMQGPGQSVLSTLLQEQYPAIYRSQRRSVAAVNTGPLPTLGWHTSPTSKMQMVEEVKANLESGWLCLSDIHLGAELKQFVRKGQGNKMGGSPHDDRVMALCLAVVMLPYATDSLNTYDASLTEFTEEWWRKVAELNGLQPVARASERGFMAFG